MTRICGGIDQSQEVVGMEDVAATVAYSVANLERDILNEIEHQAQAV